MIKTTQRRVVSHDQGEFRIRFLAAMSALVIVCWGSVSLFDMRQDSSTSRTRLILVAVFFAATFVGFALRSMGRAVKDPMSFWVAWLLLNAGILVDAATASPVNAPHSLVRLSGASISIVLATLGLIFDKRRAPRVQDKATQNEVRVDTPH